MKPPRPSNSTWRMHPSRHSIAERPRRPCRPCWRARGSPYGRLRSSGSKLRVAWHGVSASPWAGLEIHSNYVFDETRVWTPLRVESAPMEAAMRRREPAKRAAVTGKVGRVAVRSQPLVAVRDLHAEVVEDV